MFFSRKRRRASKEMPLYRGDVLDGIINTGKCNHDFASEDKAWFNKDDGVWVWILIIAAVAVLWIVFPPPTFPTWR